MSLKYLNEHTTCFNYDNRKDAFVRLIKGDKNAQGSYTLNTGLILCVISGEAVVSYENYSDIVVSKGELVYIPIGSELVYKLSARLKGLVFHLDDEIRLCDCYHLDALAQEIDEDEEIDSPFKLKMTKEVITFMSATTYYLEQQLLCRSFLELKMKELLYLLRAFYTKKELALFFYPGIFYNTTFSAVILRNYRKCNTVAELADFVNYTVSGFEKRFKKTFGVAPAKWLREKKSQQIYKDVNQGELNFKEISDKYGFSSTSTFNDFYKQNFGETPGSARKGKERSD